MAALTACDPSDEGLDFTRLKGVTGATDGNLARISIISPAPAMSRYQGLRRPRPRTTVKASPQGRAAFARHVAFLKAIIAGA